MYTQVATNTDQEKGTTDKEKILKILTKHVTHLQNYSDLSRASILAIFIVAVVALVLASIAYSKIHANPIETGSLYITWNISDPNATIGPALDLWIYTKNGNTVIVKASGFFTPLSITSGVFNRYFIGSGLPNSLLPGPTTTTLWILTATYDSDLDYVYTGVVRFNNTKNTANNGLLTLSRSTAIHTPKGFMCSDEVDYPATYVVGTAPYSFSYVIA